MNTLVKRIIVSVLLASGSHVQAQQTPLVNHTYVNPYWLNPAYAGERGTNMNILNRLQWVGVDGAPETQIASLDGMIKSSNLGYGLIISNDVVNILGKTGLYGTYSYKLPISKTERLSFGLTVGFEQNRILFDRIRANNPYEVDLSEYNYQNTNFDANAGLAYSSERLTIGLSSYQLLNNENPIEGYNLSYAFKRHFMGNVRYRLDLDPGRIFLDPSLIVRYASEVSPQADISVMLNFDDNAWIGGAYRTGYGAYVMAGGVLGGRLVGSYSYGRNIGPLQRIGANSHEVTIGYKFNGVIASNDADGDGVMDAIDKQPNTPSGCPVDGNGVALDSDIDGVPNCMDQEVNTPLGAQVDRNGIALDDDHDGVINLYDREPNSPKDCPVDKLGVALDTDLDGVSDCKDKELNTPLGAKVDAEGVALDTDGDGVINLYDRQPNSPEDCPVDQLGIALDRDMDGVPDCRDLESTTPMGALVDGHGRALDSDKDGVPDGIDREKFSKEGAEVDKWGVAIPDPMVLDDDGDGVPNAIDMEPNTPAGVSVDVLGREIRMSSSTAKNRLEIKDMEDHSKTFDYYVIVGVFKNPDNLGGYQSKLQKEYGESTGVLKTAAGYHYVYTKQVYTKEEAYAESDRLTSKNVEDYIVGNPWLWEEPKK